MQYGRRGGQPNLQPQSNIGFITTLNLVGRCHSRGDATAECTRLCDDSKVLEGYSPRVYHLPGGGGKTAGGCNAQVGDGARGGCEGGAGDWEVPNPPLHYQDGGVKHVLSPMTPKGALMDCCPNANAPKVWVCGCSHLMACRWQGYPQQQAAIGQLLWADVIQA